MILSTLTRLFLARRLRPFEFLPEPGFLPEYKEGQPVGLYIHVPFCESLCPFCPYYKTLYDEALARDYVEALLGEIDLVASRLGPKRKVSSLYFGGGSPALIRASLGAIIGRVRERFELAGPVGIELHPRDVAEEALDQIKEAGATMASLGAQSFQGNCLAALGRTGEDPLAALDLLARKGFDAIDVDLIFGIPGQDGESLLRDFALASEHGATQVSTYPFIDFSYAKNGGKPLGGRAKRKMLEALVEGAAKLGFERSSVWTFGKAGAPRYSSITRDSFIGLGPSATSLGLADFKMNSFSVQAYIGSIKEGTIPTALRMAFNARERGMYWLFWNCYKGEISSRAYRDTLDRDLASDFGSLLRLSTFLKLTRRRELDGETLWSLAGKGSYLFHLVEQGYTLQYIDKTWRASLESAWPKKISLY